jgi:hypothetical protein
MDSKYIPQFVQQDGSFCVVVKFTTTQATADLQNKIANWCNQWIKEHKHWQRPTKESPSNADDDPWDYLEIFTGPPYVIKAEDSELWLRFDGRVYSYWWRDWFAPMMGHLVREFPELQPEDRLSFSCEGATD